MTANSLAADSSLAPGALLDPDSAANRPVLRSLASNAGRILTDRVRERLTDGAARLSASSLRIVFGGHFSSGKSSMINMLIGRPLLPVSDYPETGVACFVSAGPADSIRGVYGSRTGAIAFSTDSIAASVSLIGADGDYRAAVKKTTRLDVTLAASPIGPDTVWVDSPGINDTAEMTARATAVADTADVLVWLVSSRQPVSEVEQAVLRDHIARHGPASVVFVVNAFLDTDTPGHWERFLEDQAPAHQVRIEQAIDIGTVPKRIVFASARAAAADPGGFGGPQAIALLGEMTGPGYWRAAATRSFQVKAEMIRLGAELDRRISQEEASLAAERAKRAQAATTQTRRRGEFLQAIGRRIPQLLARQRAVADAAVQAAVDMVDASTRPVNFYGQDLTTRLQVTADAIVADIVAAASAEARTYGQRAPSAAARRELAALLAPAAVTVLASMPAGGVGKAAAIGAGTGLAAGTIVPILGHAVGPIVGAIVGGFGAKAARAQQLDALRTEVRQAGDAAVTAMCGCADAAIALIERSYPRPSAQPGPDQNRLVALRQAGQHLSELAAALTDSGTVR
jgi:Dynamin family